MVKHYGCLFGFPFLLFAHAHANTHALYLAQTYTFSHTHHEYTYCHDDTLLHCMCVIVCVHVSYYYPCFHDPSVCLILNVSMVYLVWACYNLQLGFMTGFQMEVIPSSILILSKALSQELQSNSVHKSTRTARVCVHIYKKPNNSHQYKMPTVSLGIEEII